MADVSGTPDGGQSFEREAVGFGLLSRFIGAVFLVLLGGSLLLDRALLRANHNQAELDARSAALLTESFIASRAVLLERVAELAAHPQQKDSATIRATLAQLLTAAPDTRRVLATDRGDRPILTVVGPGDRVPPAPSPDLL